LLIVFYDEMEYYPLYQEIIMFIFPFDSNADEIVTFTYFWLFI